MNSAALGSGSPILLLFRQSPKQGRAAACGGISGCLSMGARQRSLRVLRSIAAGPAVRAQTIRLPWQTATRVMLQVLDRSAHLSVAATASKLGRSSGSCAQHRCISCGRQENEASVAREASSYGVQPKRSSHSYRTWLRRVLVSPIKSHAGCPAERYATAAQNHRRHKQTVAWHNPNTRHNPNTAAGCTYLQVFPLHIRGQVVGPRLRLPRRHRQPLAGQDCLGDLQACSLESVPFGSRAW